MKRSEINAYIRDFRAALDGIAALGTEPVCVLKGLGEYPEVRKCFITHARAASAL